eukprot:gene11616-12675_t
MDRKILVGIFVLAFVGLVQALQISVSGPAAESKFGSAVQGIGDFNGDGYGDFVVGAPSFSSSTKSKWYNGKVFVIYGHANITSTITTADLPKTKGFSITGESSNDFMGAAVANAGDINGDGLNDIIVSTTNYSPTDELRNVGRSYVIYGKKNQTTDIDLSTLSSTQGFHIQGANAFDTSGCSVSTAGDVNGDGIDDIIIGAYNATNKGYANTGAAYVIYGKRSGLTDINLGSLTKAQGFAIYGGIAGEGFGYSVSAADVDNDGYSDLIIGAYYYNGFSGRVIVVYGETGTRDDVQVKQLKQGREGFIINAASVGGGLGITVAGVGDVNGDKYPDIIIGANWATYFYRTFSGAAYVIYGGKTLSGQINLASITKTDGYVIVGPKSNSYTGISVADAGDVNGDGLHDVIVGSNRATVNGLSNAGMANVIYGQSGTRDLLDLNYFSSSQGIVINGIQANGYTGAAVGGNSDFNRDNCSDIIVGTMAATVGGAKNVGTAYVITGTTTPVTEGDSTPTYIMGLSFSLLVVVFICFAFIACGLLICLGCCISFYCNKRSEEKERKQVLRLDTASEKMSGSRTDSDLDISGLDLQYEKSDKEDTIDHEYNNDEEEVFSYTEHQEKEISHDSFRLSREIVVKESKRYSQSVFGHSDDKDLEI